MVIRGTVHQPLISSGISSSGLTSSGISSSGISSSGKTIGAKTIESKKISSDTIKGDILESKVIEPEVVRIPSPPPTPVVSSEVIEEVAKGSPVTENLEELEKIVPKETEVPIESIPEEIRGLWSGETASPKEAVDYGKLAKYLGIGSGAALGSLAAYGLVKGIKNKKNKKAS